MSNYLQVIDNIVPVGTLTLVILFDISIFEGLVIDNNEQIF